MFGEVYVKALWMSNGVAASVSLMVEEWGSSEGGKPIVIGMNFEQTTIPNKGTWKTFRVSNR